MEEKASSLLVLNVSMKKSREELKPLREQLISEMKSLGKTSVSVANMEIKLIEKKSRKTVGSKAIFAIIKDKLGEEAATTVRETCERAKGEPVSKHSLKFCEAS